jgi:nicotinate-nucleotide--dimethylbenzimidazole phosphoribosyltransferase
MAPNNALRRPKPENVDTTTTAGTADFVGSTDDVTRTARRTTILPAGTVESRGIGVSSSVSTTTTTAGTTSTTGTVRRRVQDEIDAFVHGEARLSFTSELRCFFTVWTFITRFPGPTWVDHHPGYLMRGMVYFPLGGSIIGIWIATWYDLASTTLQLPASVASCIAIASGLYMTGCFHEDGLGDSADGFGGGWSRSQILTIMTDTRLGTFGCVTLLLFLVAKVQLLIAISAQEIPETTESTTTTSLLTSFWTLSHVGRAIVISQTLARCGPTYMIHAFPYVDEGGPKNKFYSFMVQARQLVTTSRVFIAVLYCFGVAMYLYDSVTGIVLLLAVVFAFGHGAGRYSTYMIGGVMGDFLGATICLAELLVLVLIYVLSSTSTNHDNDNSLSMSQHINHWVTEYVVVNVNHPQQWWSKWQQQQHDLWQYVILHAEQIDHPIGALVRFVVLMTFTIVWCTYIGHPDVFVRDTVIQAQESSQDNDDIQIALPIPSNQNIEKTTDTQSPMGPAKLMAETVCQSPSSSFRERYEAVRVYLDALAKPVGSLGTLEDWVARLAALQRTTNIRTDPVVCLIFAADHGVAADIASGGEGCSAFPQAVTRSVLIGLERGIAGASVLAQQNGVRHLRVVDVGVIGDLFPETNTVVTSSSRKLPHGTRNFCSGDAMTTSEVNRCVQIGRDVVAEYVVHDVNAKVLILGEVGIGNTTSSSALISYLTKSSVDHVCGGGATTSRTASKDVIANKISIVGKALQYHRTDMASPMDALAKLGGAEIAALVGAFLEASERNIAVLVDGLVVTTAALIAVRLSPMVSRSLFFATQSTEPGQGAAIQNIHESVQLNNDMVCPAPPALAMSLRMGEGTGALLALPILHSTVSVMNNMGTIAEIFAE